MTLYSPILHILNTQQADAGELSDLLRDAPAHAVLLGSNDVGRDNKGDTPPLYISDFTKCVNAIRLPVLPVLEPLVMCTFLINQPVHHVSLYSNQDPQRKPNP